MHLRRTGVILGMIFLSIVIVLSGCQKSETPPQTAAQPAKPVPPPPPPPPPDTSQGKLVSVERSDKTMTHVIYLTTSGVASEERLEKAGKGKTFVILHFEGKGRPGEPKLWLTDASGKKYSEGYGYSKKRGIGQIAYEVPADTTGLVWHDGKQAYKLEPVIVAVEPTSAESQAAAKP